MTHPRLPRQQWRGTDVPIGLLKVSLGFVFNLNDKAAFRADDGTRVRQNAEREETVSRCECKAEIFFGNSAAIFVFTFEFFYGKKITWASN